jgi:hypothetical protein
LLALLEAHHILHVSRIRVEKYSDAKWGGKFNNFFLWNFPSTHPSIHLKKATTIIIIIIIRLIAYVNLSQKTYHCR